MLKLLKNVDLYTPRHLGASDVLLADARIMRIAPRIDLPLDEDMLEVIDLKGKLLCPGFIDLHMHITGGGGEQGPRSQVPELHLSTLIQNGVTGLVGLLGTDGVNRSLEGLVSKAAALREYGLCAYTLTGSYQYPSCTLTGSVTRDIVLVEGMIGAKVALSDHRSSGITVEELVRLSSEVRLGGMLASKPGILVIHMGKGSRGMQKIFQALECAEVPISTFLPTHVSSQDNLIEDGIRLAKMGGTIDMSAVDPRFDPAVASRAIARCLEAGVEPGRITMSSDANGSQPSFNEAGDCTGAEYTSPAVLLDEVRRMVTEESIPLETALAFITKNPARVLKREQAFGVVSPGAWANLVAMDRDFTVTDVLIKGNVAMRNGRLCMRGLYE